MVPSEEDIPWVGLPERVDRRLRLGPFPSARDALKFLCYAAAGALLAPLVNVPIGLAVVAFGFLVATWQPDGQAWDERALAILRWKWRSGRREVPVTARSGNPLLRHGFVRLSSAQYVAVVRTGGIPMAYLPPAELSRRFEQFRDLLRATDGRFVLLSTLVTIHGSPFFPRAEGATGPDSESRSGYTELVQLLCRRRLGRRVYIAVGSTMAGSEAVARLEGQVSSLIERLTAFGLHAVRLRDRELLEAARRFGWTGEAAGT
jgi:hypothetical protein